MSAKSANLAASVHARLLNLARGRGEDFQFVVTRFAVERLLYRMSKSPHAGRFVLKGAMLMMIWAKRPFRPTRDLDLLGFGESSAKALEAVFRDICRTPVDDDGLRFDSDSISAADIREGQDYGGQRVKLMAHLGRARIPLQVDVGFGDVVTPGARQVEYPSLLDFSPPKVRAYSMESVVAEKFQAMVSLGITNSRMKDYYDLYTVAQRFDFNGSTLARAIKATFKRRKTALPAALPIALSGEFSADAGKRAQWTAFLDKAELTDAPADLRNIVRSLCGFLMPVVESLVADTAFKTKWTPPGPWVQKTEKDK